MLNRSCGATTTKPLSGLLYLPQLPKLLALAPLSLLAGIENLNGLHKKKTTVRCCRRQTPAPRLQRRRRGQAKCAKQERCDFRALVVCPSPRSLTYPSSDLAHHVGLAPLGLRAARLVRHDAVGEAAVQARGQRVRQLDRRHGAAGERARVEDRDLALAGLGVVDGDDDVAVVLLLAGGAFF